HALGLLLLGWALAPAGGRREERTFVPALAGFLILTAAYTASFFPGYTAPWLGELRVPLFLAAALVLAASLALIPRPPLAPRLAPLGTCAVAVALLVATAGVCLSREPFRALAVRPGGGSPANGVRVASYNVHWAVRPDRVFDPPAIARALRATGATLISVQEVSAGLPALYGIDLALWLGRSLGMEARFAPAAGDLLGNAFLSAHPVAHFGSTRLPTTDTVSGRQLDPRALARIEVRTPAGPLRAVGTRLGPDSGAQRAQIGVLLAALPAEGPVVLLGDLNAPAASPTLAALRAVGLRDPFPEDAVAWTRAASDSRPARIDRVLVRGYSAGAAAVYDAPASDHLPVAVSIWLHRD
ncbi:MAG: endonuclease/exonuclease/phosphatase family protein, partial [Longimicrobiales bacterium]